jgi:hypothetical protein
MIKEFTSFCSLLFLLNMNYTKGQNLFQKQNELPSTLEVEASEFNTEKNKFSKLISPTIR